MEIRREISVAKQLKFRVADNKVYSFEQISSFNCLGPGGDNNRQE